MALLVISANANPHATSHAKLPGLRFVEALADAGLFTLFDVPSTVYERSVRGATSILWRYAKSAIGLLRYRDEEIFFYNWPLAYVPLYIVALLATGRRPSLLLADGINCVGIARNPARFFRLFRRVMSLPLNDVIENTFSGSPRFIWFPGFSALDGKSDQKVRPADSTRVRVLFNSSFLAHNSPESTLTLALEHDWLDIAMTETEARFRSYLDGIGVSAPKTMPINLRFTGPLPFAEYLVLAETVDAILLCRDELIFANKFNFPSKFIEALQLNVPLVSLFRISGVPDTLYHRLDSTANSESATRAYLAHWEKGGLEVERSEFLARCDARRLSRWLVPP